MENFIHKLIHLIIIFVRKTLVQKVLEGQKIEKNSFIIVHFIVDDWNFFDCIQFIYYDSQRTKTERYDNFDH